MSTLASYVLVARLSHSSDIDELAEALCGQHHGKSPARPDASALKTSVRRHGRDRTTLSDREPSAVRPSSLKSAELIG